MDFLITPAAYLIMLAFFAAGALGALLLWRNDRAANAWSHWLAIAGSAAGLIFSGAVLYKGVAPSFAAVSSLPLLSLSFRIDRLSAFFMLVISLVALACSIYALGYVRHYYGNYSIGVLGFFYNIFIASMIAVVTAHNALFFLIVWEVMALASYFLVVYENREPSSIRAGSLYFIMTHAGTVFIIIAFLLMYRCAGSFDFGALRDGLSDASPLMRNAIFVSALIGFGAKAGIIPLHVWLPSAHPAAPSHVSALMSGVMIKTGIYMMIRIYLDFLPGSYLWWGLALLVAGAISSLLGVLYALSESDLKRMLAYSSIENIGIILLGLGSALVFQSFGLDSLAALGLAAALFHTINHAAFKALLFLGAGSVINATHTRNIEKYGGLIKVMPQTAFFFLIGSIAIAALPPLNGFFSEWLTFQALFQGVMAFDVATKVVFILAIGSLAFTGGLAAACFVKAFGITFLARPRSEQAMHASESARSLLVAMAGLSLVVAGLGLFAGVVLGELTPVAGSLANLRGAQAADVAGFRSVSIEGGFASVSMPALFFGLAAVIATVAVAVRILARRRKVRTGPTWDCGTDLTPRMEINAEGFSRSLITVMRGVLRPSSETEIEYHDASGYFPRIGTVTMGLHDIYQTYIYKPLRDLTTMVAGQVTKVQSGNVNAYILYIFLTLIGLLFFLDVQS
ncbi:MAG: hydrogenase 4 subunit B [Actinobacteria bacterium]|nr:hydrogenase 4 subunit B [Actinomycetota bacterium]